TGRDVIKLSRPAQREGPFTGANVPDLRDLVFADERDVLIIRKKGQALPAHPETGGGEAPLAARFQVPQLHGVTPIDPPPPPAILADTQEVRMRARMASHLLPSQRGAAEPPSRGPLDPPDCESPSAYRKVVAVRAEGNAVDLATQGIKWCGQFV